MNNKLSRTIFAGLVLLTLGVFLCVVVFYLFQGSIDYSFVSGGVSRTTSANLSNIASGNPSKSSSRSVTVPRPSSTKSSSSASSSEAPSGRLTSCSLNSQCGSGLECRDGICVFVKVSKPSGSACGQGGGFCPNPSDTCKSGKCVSAKVNNTNVEFYAVNNALVQVKAPASESDPSQEYQCTYVSPTSQRCTNPQTGATNIYGGVCCKGYDPVKSDLLKTICEDSGNPDFCEGVGDGNVYGQNNYLVANYPVSGASGSCTFLNVGCGPTSALYVLREQGLDYKSPIELLEGGYYPEFNCAGSSLSDNYQTLKSHGVPVAPLATEELSVNNLTSLVGQGNQVYIRMKVVEPDGDEYFHYAVIQGQDSSGNLQVFDPYLGCDGKVKSPNAGDELCTLNQMQSAYGYEIIHAFLIGD